MMQVVWEVVRPSNQLALTPDELDVDLAKVSSRCVLLVTCMGLWQRKLQQVLPVSASCIAQQRWAAPVDLL